MTREDKKSWNSCGAIIVLLLIGFAVDYGLWNVWNIAAPQFGLTAVTFWTFYIIMALATNTSSLIKWTYKQLSNG